MAQAEGAVSETATRFKRADRIGWTIHRKGVLVENELARKRILNIGRQARQQSGVPGHQMRVFRNDQWVQLFL